jgi:hypothetical protein
MKLPKFSPNPGRGVYNTPGSFSLFVTITAEAPADRIQWVRVPFGSDLAPYASYIQTHVGLSKSGIRLWTSGRVWARAGDGTDWSAWIAADYTFLVAYLIRFQPPTYPEGYAG